MKVYYECKECGSKHLFTGEEDKTLYCCNRRMTMCVE